MRDIKGSAGLLAIMVLGCSSGGGGGGDKVPDVPGSDTGQAPTVNLGSALVRLQYSAKEPTGHSTVLDDCFGLDVIACGNLNGCVWSTPLAQCVADGEADPVVDVEVSVPRHVQFEVLADIQTPSPDSTGQQALGTVAVKLANNDLAIYNFSTIWVEVSSPSEGMSGVTDDRFSADLFLTGQASATVTPAPGVPAAYDPADPLTLVPGLLRQWNKSGDYPLYPAWAVGYDLIGGFPDNPLPAQVYAGNLRLDVQGLAITCASTADCHGSYECTTVDETDYCMPPVCTPSCVGMSCGDDGCGGSCGTCTGADQCTGGTCKTPKVVFVTSGTWYGNLGGIAGADQKCTTAASAAGLSGLYKAWLSTQSNSPASDWGGLQSIDPPFALPDGTLVASSWSDLTDGVLTHAIDMFETGETIPTNTTVWTATRGDGTYDDTYAPGGDCEDWTSTVVAYGADSGNAGMATRTDGWWTDWTPLNCGNYAYRLYCFQQ